MPARYYGVFCPNGHFECLGEYIIEHPEAPYGTDRLVAHATEQQCKICGKVFTYEQADVAHSNWQDGRAAKYPHKEPAKPSRFSFKPRF